MASNNIAIELFDWIVNEKNVRGCPANNRNYWQAASAKPVAFDPRTRVITLQDNKKFVLPIKNACNALKLNKSSEKFLLSLPLSYNGPAIQFQESDVFINVKDDDTTNLLKKVAPN
jgi:hypothetical protein